MSIKLIELLCPDLDRLCDDRPGPEERLLAAEAAWLAIPRRRRPSGFSAALIGVNIAWDGAVVGYTPRYLMPCPACHDHPIGRCLVCSASDEDPIRWEMMPTKIRARILAGPPLRKRINNARTRREKRETTRRSA